MSNCKDDITVACYTFPGFHPSYLNHKIYGTAWSEYNLMRGARPWYPGHMQPKVPALGELDESKPETWEIYNDLASTYGVDVFIHDFYWYHGGPAMHEALDDGFLKSANRDKMQFAIMWTNHDWPQWIETLRPNGNGYRSPAAKSPQITVEDMYRSMAYIISRYMHLPNYWRIDGKPVLVLFYPFEFVGDKPAKVFLDEIREMACKMGHPDIHLHGSHGALLVDGIKEMGFDSYAHYNPLGDVGWNRPPEEETIDYSSLVDEIVNDYWPKWDALHDLPFFPTVAAGFDWTARMFPRKKAPDAEPNRSAWPCCILLENDTPAAFKAFVEKAVDFIRNKKVDPKILMIGCWNEWTEGHYLLPDLQYGFGRLFALAEGLGMDIDKLTSDKAQAFLGVDF